MPPRSGTLTRYFTWTGLEGLYRANPKGAMICPDPSSKGSSSSEGERLSTMGTGGVVGMMIGGIGKAGGDGGCGSVTLKE